MLDRIGRFPKRVLQTRQVETDPLAYRLAAGGFLAEIDRMQLDVREYLSIHPAEASATEAARP